MKNSEGLKWVKNGALFIGLIALTFFIILRDQSPRDLIAAITGAHVPYLLAAIGSMAVFVLCEAKNIHTGLSMFGSRAPYPSCIRYALTGFFFSSVTPSASGGQPMQVYDMHRDGLQASHSTLALLTNLAGFQIVSVTFALAGFISVYDRLIQLNSGLRLLLAVGVFLNLCVLSVVLCAIFSKKMAPAIWNALMSLAKLLHLRKADEWKTAGERQIDEYRSCACGYASNKLKVLGVLAVTCVQLLSYYTIPFWIYCACGLSGESAWTVISMQAVLFVTVSSLPLPGAVGISESGFLLLYKSLFPAELLSGAMLMTRCANFYIFVLLSGMFFAIYTFKRNLADKKRCPEPPNS